MLTYRYAPREITLLLIVGSAVTGLSAYFLHLWALLPAILTLALLSFYRDPERRPPPGDNLILAPADGRIVEVARHAEASGGGGQVLRIVIFLAVYNVHVNRAPCAGRVTDVTYRRGRFVNALNSAATAVNESNSLTIDPRAPLPGPVQVRQIAGVLARRIVCTARPGCQLDVGERFGMIKLGSRTEICLPEDPGWLLGVRVGQRVRAGLTVLARLGPENVTMTAVGAPDALRASADPNRSVG